MGSTKFTSETSYHGNEFAGDIKFDLNFYNWNRYYIIYCDGTGHQGYIEQPIVVNNTKLYFRGYNNTLANYNFVFSHLPPELMDTLVVNGCSAGGLATFTWLETIGSYVLNANPKVKVIGLIDAGFFLDYPSNKTGKKDYGTMIQAITQLVNKNVPLPNSKCVADNLANPHYCMMAPYLVNYITIPFFIS